MVFIRGKLIRYDREVTVPEAEPAGSEDALSWIMSGSERRILNESDSLLANVI